ncbi:hypothetical protein BT96DRAFT_1016377 [Gymnopus androsaceus JB14]|uniref:Uncharacterized protein n=1 Tax=Gymnopus androsaceus JB14 TaxID=1447944 RepID=A0A6A4I308_9AGAR|nr:hypothetical protein BT96DRAFT_1016377 [Gymnopus androsaceus JB14]
MLPVLPEELLEHIVVSIASDTVFIERQLAFLRWKYASSKLLSLSIANRQFRRLCLPYLVSNIQIHSEDIETLVEYCIVNEAFAMSIRSLNVRQYSSHDIMTFLRLLHRLKNLSMVNLNDVELDTSLLTAINSHPVSNVIVSSPRCKPGLLAESPDLNKIIFDHARATPNDNLASYRTCGAQVWRLDIELPVQESFITSTAKFHGICELKILIDTRPTGITLSLLTEFARTSPFLKKICFSKSTAFAYFKSNDTVPFIQPFLERLRQEKLDNLMDVKAFSVTLGIAEPALAGEWYVSGLHLCIPGDSSEKLLHFAHSSFPQVSTLTIEDSILTNEGLSTSFDEFIPSLCHFSSLQVMTLVYPIHFLHLDLDRSCPESVLCVEMESAIIDFTSCIAQQIPSIERFTLIRLDYERWLAGTSRDGLM